jgi:WD40 repeat protein
MTIQLNPTTSDAYESKTLAQLRQMVFDSMGFLNLLAATKTETLGAIRGDIYNMLGMGAMTIPLPGVVSMLNSFINEAQQTLFRTVEFGTGALTAPAILVNDTDISAIDGTAIRQLALGMAKAHYGQQDGQIYLQQNAKYLKDLVSRLPPNATSLINRLLKNAQFMLYRRYPVFRMERWFTWTFTAGQRFYSITGNDERAPLAAPTGVTVNPGVAGNYGSLNAARNLHTSTLLQDGRILVTSGADLLGNLNSAELYDPATGLFSYTGNVIQRRQNHTANLLADGRVLIAGGDNGTYLNYCEVFSPSGGAFSAVGQLNFARSFHTATTLADGRVLIAGGGTNSLVTTCEIFTPGTNLFTTTGSLAAGRFSAAAALLSDGNVMIAGGQSAGVLTSVEVYNPTTGVWATASGVLSAGRYGCSAVQMSNGKVLIVGGLNGAASARVNCDIFDPSTGSVTATGSLAHARAFATLTLLPNGKVLTTGGQDNVTGETNTAELFNPATGTWSTVGTGMSVAREFHTATYSPYTLKVYIIGGSDGTVPLASAELYDYATNTFSPSGIHGSTSRAYRVAFVDNNGKTTLASSEVSNTIPGDTGAVITWTLPTNETIKYAVIYGRTAGLELRIAQVDASLGTYTDVGTIVPSGALPTVNTTGNVGPVLDQREISWVGISQGDVGWRPLAKSVPPTNYSNLVTAIPNFYDIREQIEVWPAPVSNAWQLRIKGYFTPGPFELDTDTTTIDWQVVYLQAVADAKVAFKQPDAGLAQAQLRTYIGDLVAGTHGTRRYIPGPPGQLPMTRPIALDANGNPLP